MRKILRYSQGMRNIVRMRTVMLVLFLFTSIWSHGEDWKTTDGKIYQGVTVVKHDDATVTVLCSDGGATIPLEKLDPDLQQKFGYDPQKAQNFAVIQQYRQQIAQLQEENAKLRQALSQYKGVQANTQSRPTTVAAFHCYLYQTVVAVSTLGGPRGGDAAVYLSGPYQGLTLDQATGDAQRKWAALSDDDKAKYEKMAEETGDPIEQKNATDASKPTQIIPGPIISNTMLP